MLEKKCDFLFLLEHEDREGASVRFLVKKLTEKGFSCIVMSLEFHVHRFAHVNPSAVILPYAFASDQWPINYLANLYRSASWFCLSWEQLLTPINMYYKKPRDSFIRDNFYHLAWAENFKSFLTDNQVPQEKVTVCGNVANELLELQSKEGGKIKEYLAGEHGLDKDKRWMFMPMNYSWAFVTDANINGKISRGYDSKNAWIYRDYAKKCIAEFVHFISDVAERYSDVLIIIRPHPSVSVEQYLKVFQQSGVLISSNIFFSKQQSIREWIAASDVVGSSWSSSVWDAIQSGKKGFLYTPYEKPDWHVVWWEEKVLNVTTSKEFDLDKLMSGGSNSSAIGAGDKVVEWLTSNYKQCASQVGMSPPKALSGQKVFARRIRSLMRSFSMKYLNGLGVAKGMQRDYFPIEQFNTK